MDNLLLGPDAQINHIISALKHAAVNEQLTDGLAPVPGSLFGIDPEGQIKGRIVSGGNGSLFKLDYKVARAPRWLALHLSIGEVNLSDKSILGIVIKSRSPNASTFRLCLRSASSGGFVDAFLPKHVVAFSEASTHIDLLKFERNEHVPTRAKWRELVFFFANHSASFEIIDLRVFIV